MNEPPDVSMIHCSQSYIPLQEETKIVSLHGTFFGTSNGKCFCDGIKGVVKYMAAKAGIHSEEILTPQQLQE
jgi:hypothetical protein